MEEEFSQEELKYFIKMPEAAFDDLKQTLERINSMSENELVHKLKCFHLDTNGDVGSLKKMLKTSYKKVSLVTTDLSLSSKLLPYYVVIDFEATCQEINAPNFRHEIIEFPAVLVHSKKQKIIDCFQMYCKPQINPQITEFCTELTGITQEQVDSAELFEKVLEHFENWLAKHNLGKVHKYAIVTDGPLDMCKFLFSQCYYSNIKYPKWATKWVNLKKACSKFYQCERMCLRNMLEFLKMNFVGRPHCGLDDSKNIARILLRMIYDGANIQVNERISMSKKPRTFKVNDNCQNKESCQTNDLNQCINIPRIDSHYATIYTAEKMPVYKKSKRDRLIAEAQVARKILSGNGSTEINGECKLKSRKKKKLNKEI